MGAPGTRIGPRPANLGRGLRGLSAREKKLVSCSGQAAMRRLGLSGDLQHLLYVLYIGVDGQCRAVLYYSYMAICSVIHCKCPQSRLCRTGRAPGSFVATMSCNIVYLPWGNTAGFVFNGEAEYVRWAPEERRPSQTCCSPDPASCIPTTRHVLFVRSSNVVPASAASSSDTAGLPSLGRNP
jgi:hypothetical protein